MEGATHPYVKLSQTPLAQKTTFLGLPAKTASIIMGLFALVVGSGTHFVLGTLLLKARPAYPEDQLMKHGSSSSMFGSTFMDEARQKNEDRFNYSVLSVVAGLTFFCAVITTITGIIVLVGALQTRPQLFLPWFMSLFFGIFIGRLGPLIASIFGINPYTVFFILMACVDIVTLVLLIICWGLLAGVQRNNKYMNMTLSPRHIVKSGDGGGVLLPPGSYPRQEV